MRFTKQILGLLAAVTALGVLGVAAAAGTGIPNGKYELRPEAGQEVDRNIPSTKSKSTAPRIVPGAASAIASSNPGASGFTGLTFKDHRDADGGNQTSDTPPDQGLCAGSGLVVEPVNTTFSTYSTSGSLVSGPTSLTEFFTQQHEIDRTLGTFGPFLSDPKCYYDPGVKRFFMTILQLPFTSDGQFVNGRSNVLIAVSKTSTPTTSRSDWTFFALNTTDDGSAASDGSGNTMPSDPGCPCFGDQPLLGADQNGIYITTNEFSILGPEFNGAQIYAISKSALLAGTLKYQAFHGAPIALAEGAAYSVQPATSPTAGSWNTANSGTEYLLSALDFDATTDNRLAVWALTNTASLNGTPAVTLAGPTTFATETYGQPPNAQQKKGPTPFGNALGEPEEQVATNDDRMNQVVYANHTLFGAVNTVIRTSNGKSTNTDRSGIAYFAVTPSTPSSSTVSATVAKQGYIALGNNDNVFFPSIAVNAAGSGVMTFSLAGQHAFPSAAYATLDAVNGAGPIHIAANGAGPTDDISGYAAYGGDGVARWGDYSAAVPAEDGSIWIATEYIPGGFGFPDYLNNWGTWVGHVTP